MKTNSDYNDLLQLLNEHGVRYLIAGSYAVMKYTEPIWSKDIDVWIDPVSDNALKVLDALRRFGAPVSNLSIEDLTDPTTIFQIGVDGNRIDILTSISGLTFAEAWEKRDSFQLETTHSPVLSIEDTIRAAKASGRVKDRARIRALQKAVAIRTRLNK